MTILQFVIELSVGKSEVPPSCCRVYLALHNHQGAGSVIDQPHVHDRRCTSTPPAAVVCGVPRPNAGEEVPTDSSRVLSAVEGTRCGPHTLALQKIHAFARPFHACESITVTSEILLIGRILTLLAVFDYRK